MTDSILGGVLVGGSSRRMGRPKQLIEIDDVTMTERVVRALVPEVDEVVLLGAGAVPVALETLARIEDAVACRGPMAGILGAMSVRPDACWVVAACDQPLLERAAVRWLVGSRRPETWVVLSSIDGFVEPLPGLFEPEARSLLENAAAAGEHALHRLAGSPRVTVAEPPAHLQRCWLSTNTPQELTALLAD